MSTPATRATLSSGANDVQTTFFIAKSDDRNRVDYGMRLDTNRAPVGAIVRTLLRFELRFGSLQRCVD